MLGPAITDQENVKPKKMRHMKEKETPVCPECGGTDIDILDDEGVAICNDCHLEWPYVED